MKILLQKLLRFAERDASRRLLSVASDERVYAIGDVHGRNDLLVAMLERLTKDACGFGDDRKARFIFLGDYVDRGDQSAQVLQTLCDVKEASNNSFDFLMGNHEAAMLAFLEDPIAGANWIGWGGLQTLTSYGIRSASRRPDKNELISMRDALQEKAQRHLCFLRSLQRYAVSGDVVYAHANLEATLPLEDQPDEALLWGQTSSQQSAGLPGHRLVHGHYAANDRLCCTNRGLRRLPLSPDGLILRAL